MPVRANFDAWDADDDDVLSPNEIELAVHNPRVIGKSAAAAAALRRAIRGDHSILSLSLAQIADSIPYKANATPKRPKYESMYAAAVERIENARREIFVSKKPMVECVSQGRLGDYFLLATLGTVAYHDPNLLIRMFRPFDDGKVEVTFSGERKFVIDMPTDAEICIGARNSNDGMWAALFEKAIGTIYLERQAIPSETATFPKERPAWKKGFSPNTANSPCHWPTQ